jgi:RNA polymerase sigma-70 factor (ECF subfamily)
MSDAMNPIPRPQSYPLGMTAPTRVPVTGSSAPRSHDGAAVGASHAPDVDAHLLRRIEARDAAALAEFYDRWFPVVNCLITRIVKVPHDAEDVVEETFWQVWKQASRYEPARGSVQTWLLTMARSRALDRLRANRRMREDSIDDSDGVSGTFATLAASANDPSLDAEHAERKRIVLAALATLPAEQRQALELGYFSGLSQSEIAERTGLPLGTIKTRMRIAMQKLRERLSVLREEAR